MPVETTKNINHRQYIEYKNFSFELKDMDGEGKFQGMLSTNGNIDPVNDRFNPGTWKRTIKNRGDKPFPLLWGHDSKWPLGSFFAKDIEEGLFIRDGRLNLSMIANSNIPKVPKAHEAHALYRDKDLDGLSVGFRNIESATKYPKEKGIVIRDMFEAQLFEGSFAPVPMNIEAIVTNIKSWGDLFSLIIKNLNDKDLKYKILSLYGIDPESVESTLNGESDFDFIQEIESKKDHVWFKDFNKFIKEVSKNE